MNVELSDVERVFVEWHATPKASRNPSTFKELCKSLGFTEQTGYRWLKRTNIEAAIHDLVKQAVGGADRVMAVVDSMFNAATSSDRDRVQAATTFLKYAGVLNDKPDLRKASDIEELNEEELAVELERIAIKRASAALKG